MILDNSVNIDMNIEEQCHSNISQFNSTDAQMNIEGTSDLKINFTANDSIFLDEFYNNRQCIKYFNERSGDESLIDIMKYICDNKNSTSITDGLNQAYHTKSLSSVKKPLNKYINGDSVENFILFNKRMNIENECRFVVVKEIVNGKLGKHKNVIENHYKKITKNNVNLIILLVRDTTNYDTFNEQFIYNRKLKRHVSTNHDYNTKCIDDGLLLLLSIKFNIPIISLDKFRDRDQLIKKYSKMQLDVKFIRNGKTTKTIY